MNDYSIIRIALTPVETVETREQAVKGARKGIQALSKAADVAKRALNRNIALYQSKVEAAANVEFYAAKKAFFAANPEATFWPGAVRAGFVTAGGNTINSVPRLISQLREFGFANDASEVEILNNAYLLAKAAHQAAKA